MGDEETIVDEDLKDLTPEQIEAMTCGTSGCTSCEG